MSDMPKFSSYKELKDYFANLLGEGSVLATSTGRPYVKIADKNGAMLLMNVALDQVQYKGTIVRSVCARFFQRGGEEDTFQPPLKVRATSEDASMRRLSKHHFPLCPVHPGVNPVLSWQQQNVTDLMVSWVKGVVVFAQATPVADEIIKGIILLSLPEMKEFDVTGDVNLFNLDVQVEEEEAPAPSPGSEEPQAAPPAATPVHLN